MDSSRTISALISWGNVYRTHEQSQESSRPLLRVEEHAGQTYLVPQSSLSFWEKVRDCIFSLFGLGDRAFARVFSVARKALCDMDAALYADKRHDLEHALSLLNKKAMHYNSRKWLNLFKMPRATISRLLVPPHCGITNEGNTCFAAATLQALLPLHPTITHEGLRSFCEAVERGGGVKKGIRSLLESLSNRDWRYERLREGDPVTFLEDGLLGYLKSDLRWVRKGTTGDQSAILHQNVASFPAGETMQEVVNGKYFKHPVEVASPIPKTFAVCLQGRESGESYNDKPVKKIDTVELSVDGDKKVPYRLASIVMYADHHYYTLVPEYNNDGKIASWTECNDSVVSRVERTLDLDQLLESRGYLFFYAKTN